MISIYADGADLETMRRLADDPRVVGFTTNPSLARRAGVTDYLAFCRTVLALVRPKPASLEVLSDDPSEVVRQGRLLAGLGENVVVKVPVVNSDGQTLAPAITELASVGVSVNVTAVLALSQVATAGAALAGRPGIVSVFAGRVADTGADPSRHMTLARGILRDACPDAELLWASARQVYDAVLAECAGADIITLSPDLIAKLALLGKDHIEYSRETVAGFAADAAAAGFEL